MKDLDIINAFEQEFCQAINPWCDDVIPADGYDVFLKAIGKKPDASSIQRLTTSDLQKLKQEAENFLEADQIPLSAIQETVERTLWRIGKSGADH